MIEIPEPTPELVQRVLVSATNRLLGSTTLAQGTSYATVRRTSALVLADATEHLSAQWHQAMSNAAQEETS